MTALYVQYFVVGLLGAILHALFKIKSIQEKAKLANVKFSAMDYWNEDWVSHITSITTILLCLFFVADVLHVKPEFTSYMRVGFAFIGYVGNDIASRFFGAVNKRVNKVIDEKTTQADLLNENDSPTPHK